MQPLLRLWPAFRPFLRLRLRLFLLLPLLPFCFLLARLPLLLRRLLLALQQLLLFRLLSRAPPAMLPVLLRQRPCALCRLQLPLLLLATMRVPSLVARATMFAGSGTPLRFCPRGAFRCPHGCVRRVAVVRFGSRSAGAACAYHASATVVVQPIPDPESDDLPSRSPSPRATPAPVLAIAPSSALGAVPASPTSAPSPAPALASPGSATTPDAAGPDVPVSPARISRRAVT
jgi:hypothetical protein